MTIAETSILIVDDEPALREALTYSLSREGYAVSSAATSAEAFTKIDRQMPNFIVLDLGLPDADGLELCRRVRSRSSVPILMLTARQSEVDKIVGLEMGGDDYMTKPFSMRELLARIKAILRRSSQETNARQMDTIEFGETVIDRLAHRVTHNGEEITLTPLEFEMLSFLAENRGIVFSRETLLDRVWKYSYPEGSRTVDVHMRWLRQKIEDDPARPKILLTVRGVGYKLEA
ncbi:MAG: response regulator transcription factor [Chloroflexi bacterium]|nr:response regulator transcription factor [Chloroflexota bacterium]